MVTSSIRFDDAASPLATLRNETDQRLEREVTKRLKSSGYSSLASLECEVEHGTLTLYGTVPTYYLKQLAQHYAGKADEIKMIQNHVAVVQN